MSHPLFTHYYRPEKNKHETLCGLLMSEVVVTKGAPDCRECKQVMNTDQIIVEGFVPDWERQMREGVTS